ncbi:MAG: hypothetical protein ACREPM_21410 [Gemmatimonadaceae bacterium]
MRDNPRQRHNRRAQFYELTTAGRQQLETERTEWARFSRALSLILESG